MDLKKIVVDNIVPKDKRRRMPKFDLYSHPCTSSIEQEDLQKYFVDRAWSVIWNSDVILVDVNDYRVNEHQVANRTLQQVVCY